MRFVYSTGEKILPNNWDSNSEQAKTNIKGNKLLKERNMEINGQLNRYKEAFDRIFGNFRANKIIPTTKQLGNELDKEFKNLPLILPKMKPCIPLLKRLLSNPEKQNTMVL